MATNIVCAGFGGQGVLTAGLILAKISVDAGKNVTWIPSYGSEMRGGTANCHIKISDEEIASPFVRDIDVLIALNELAVDKFEGKVKAGGFMIVNSSIVCGKEFRKDIDIVPVPVTEVAAKAANPRGANLAMLGAFVEKTKLFEKEFFAQGIDDFFAGKGKVNPANAKCFYLGCALCHENQ
ncbi:2-oxoacid:acceptor oxidoreductase family protein [Candidatus Formimonas warabiya]|uniref:Oxidoreductase n=1 Tax=Formimonas warabiya TaxID=1761012 RepID=A0A3G1L0H1_FORW1|nr:2-oxoacid:acceptor oxidoreductase family protein [Candidatus Formimonas warabiya]ATW28148.1 oxidoreductase [Candidatus Formimonas warabiya]